MKVRKSTSYSALLFLIFIIGLVFFISVINKSLNKKSDLDRHHNDKSESFIATIVQE